MRVDARQVGLGKQPCGLEPFVGRFGFAVGRQNERQVRLGRGGPPRPRVRVAAATGAGRLRGRLRLLQRAVQRVGELERRVVPLGRIVREGAGEDGAQRRDVRAVDRGDGLGREGADTDHTAPEEHLEDQRGQAEDVGATVPCGAGDALGRGVRPADRCGDAKRIENLGNAETGDPRLVGRHQHVARMQSTVEDVDRRGEVERTAELRRNAQRFGDRGGTVIANDDVEGVGRDEIEGQERGVVGHAGRQRGGNPEMRQVCGNQTLECVNEPVGVLGRKVEPELLHRHQPTGVGLIGAIDRTEHAYADLVKNPKWPEGVRGRGAGSVRVQRGYSSREGSES